MKAQIKITKGGEGYSAYEVSLGGISAEFACGEPEDREFYRDLAGVYEIRKLMAAAHELGRKGEPLEFEETHENLDDEDEDDDS
jgi:hypothetical protein